MASKTRKAIFHNLGIWPTTAILSFFTPNEIIEISRVNKEAHYISKKVFGMRLVDLDRINIRTVKLFRRAEKLRVSHHSLNFFSQYKDVFFEEILANYRGLTKLIINLNFLFEVRQKDQLIEKLSNFSLKPNIRTLIIEDSMLNVHNLHCLLRTQFAQRITVLKLPRNNLGDSGIQFLCESDRLQHLLKLDLSSNLITKAGAEMISNAENFKKLKVLDLCSNKLGDAGFIQLI